VLGSHTVERVIKEEFVMSSYLILLAFEEF